MPYISNDARIRLAEWGDLPKPQNPGELNYCIFLLCREYLAGQHISYEALNAIIGVLECCKQEFYRRIAVPYENTKLAQNGDVE